MITCHETDGAVRLELGGVVDVRTARALHAAARAAVGTAAPRVLVDLSAVTGTDAATAQVLIALRRALGATGRACVIDGAPVAVRDQWTAGGLAGELL